MTTLDYLQIYVIIYIYPLGEDKPNFPSCVDCPVHRRIERSNFLFLVKYEFISFCILSCDQHAKYFNIMYKVIVTTKKNYFTSIMFDFSESTIRAKLSL